MIEMTDLIDTLQAYPLDALVMTYEDDTHIGLLVAPRERPMDVLGRIPIADKTDNAR